MVRSARSRSGFISSRGALRALTGLALAVLVAPGCGGKEPRQAATPAQTQAVTTPPAQGGARASGFDPGAIPEGDPRLDDIGFLRSLPPDKDLDIFVGNAFLRRGELDSAAAAYRSATVRDPSDPRGWNFLGITLSRQNRLDEAEAAYRKAVDADAFEITTHINLGNLHYKRENVDRAIMEYKLATTIDSTDARAWLNLGIAQERTEDVNAAIHAYVKAVECNNADPLPWERLGWIYYDRKMYKAARERWAGAVERDPSRSDLADNIRRLEDYADSTGTK